MANKYRADIFLLHTLENINSYPREWFSAPDKEPIEKVVGEKLGEYAEDITKKYGVYVQSIVTTGRPAFKIIEAVKEHDIDLIVMGAHGVSGFEEVFIGSTANKVVNISPCPVLTVREGSFQSDGVKAIVLPIDESRYSRQKVSNVLPLATKCKSDIHVLGIIQSDDKSDIAKLNTKINTCSGSILKRPDWFVYVK